KGFIYLIQLMETDGDGTSLVCFLLSRMNKEQLRMILFASAVRQRLFAILLSNWVCVEYFTPLVNLVVNSISSFEFGKLLLLISRYTRCLHGDSVKKCFAELWTHSSLGMKEELISGD